METSLASFKGFTLTSYSLNTVTEKDPSWNGSNVQGKITYFDLDSSVSDKQAAHTIIINNQIPDIYYCTYDNHNFIFLLSLLFQILVFFNMSTFNVFNIIILLCVSLYVVI